MPRAGQPPHRALTWDARYVRLYKRDKASTRAPSRISDLIHADPRLRAHVLLTDDRRLRNRARAAAHAMGLLVAIAGVDEAVQAISEVVENGVR